MPKDSSESAKIRNNDAERIYKVMVKK